MGGLSERASRILQGGLPLPALFHRMISYMLGNERSAPGYALTEIVRRELEDLHGPRVLAYWGSWENLTADLLEEMEEREAVTRAGDTWALTPKVYEGVRIRLMTDLRITVYSLEAAARRENLSYARIRAASYRSFLEEKGLFAGEIRDSFQRHWESLAWKKGPPLEEPEEEATYAGRRRKKGEISQFAREYMQAQYPQWVSAKEAAAAFSGQYPGQDPIRASSIWNRMQQQVWEGLAERKDGTSPGPGRNHTLFRWKRKEE